MFHLYKFQDKNILFDVGSGAVHLLTDAATTVLRGESQDPPIQAELDTLKKEGALDAPEPDPILTSPEERGAILKALCLHAAHDCNMRCGYCFAEGGGFQGKRGLLPLEIGKLALDFLLFNSKKRKNLEVDFFGGEPLMNFGVVKELVRYGKKREKEFGKNIRFTITTNGLLLDDEKIDFVNEHMDNVIISLDGREEVNDRMRKTPAGRGTYALVTDKLCRFREAREKAEKLYYVRGTYTKFNKDFSEDVRALASLGFKNISIEPAIADSIGTPPPWALDEGDLPEIFAEYDKLAELLLEMERQGKPISFFHFQIDLSGGPCAYKRAAGCGAGTEYAAITPEGDIFPCHRFAGDSSFLLGNLNALAKNDALGNFENRLFETFNKAHIYSKEDCKSCWAKYYCSGGCHATAISSNGDILRPHSLSCAIERKRLECAIALAALL